MSSETLKTFILAGVVVSLLLINMTMRLMHQHNELRDDIIEIQTDRIELLELRVDMLESRR